MNLKYSNLRYYNYEKTNDKNILSFNIDIKDIDNDFLEGETFPFTFVSSESEQYNTSEIAKQVLKDFNDGKIDVKNVQEYDDPRTIREMQSSKIDEISDFKNHLLNNTGVLYKDDLFDVDDKALLRISGIIQAYTLQIQSGIIKKEDISQQWISQSDNIHNLTFDELIELSMLMMKEVEKIVLRCNYLCQKVIPNITDKKELYFLDWFYESDNSNE